MLTEQNKNAELLVIKGECSQHGAFSTAEIQQYFPGTTLDFESLPGIVWLDEEKNWGSLDGERNIVLETAARLAIAANPPFHEDTIRLQCLMAAIHLAMMANRNNPSRLRLPAGVVKSLLETSGRWEVESEPLSGDLAETEMKLCKYYREQVKSGMDVFAFVEAK